MKTPFIDKVVNAIENREIKAYYQPQYDANTGRLVSAEALVRWEKNSSELISPDKFIPELEKTQDINILDWFMAEEACRTLRELGDRAVPIAVNFSRWHVKEKNFARKLQSLITTYDIRPELFEVEITESSLSVEDIDTVTEWAYSVADLGVKLAIDDFGEGFTSLQFVKHMPVDFLKIDKSFLEDNCQDERGRGTLETVFFFAQRLNLRTIAEGVETIEQLKFLQSMDCDRVQGYLFCRPIKKEDFLVLTMTDNSPIVEEDNYLKKQGSFSTYKLLLDAIKTEYQLIIYGNLFKNSYYLMSQGDFFFNAATAGIIDDMTDVAISMCTPDCKEEYMKKLSRAALIDAFNRGERRVEMIVKQDVGDEIATFDTVVHLSVHPYKDDILMVGFSRRLS